MKLTLVCEDSMYVRHMMVSMLRDLGLRAVLASDGREGLAMIRSFQPDLVIAEVDLAVVSGMELLRLVKGDVALSSIPWIMMGSPSRRAETMAAGCPHFLPKPIKSRALEQVVYQALHREAKNYARL